MNVVEQRKQHPHRRHDGHDAELSEDPLRGASEEGPGKEREVRGERRSNERWRGGEGKERRKKDARGGVQGSEERGVDF